MFVRVAFVIAIFAELFAIAVVTYAVVAPNCEVFVELCVGIVKL